MTTRNELRQWFDNAESRGATHLVAVCDKFDWEDYPVYVMPDGNVSKVIEEHSKNMQKVMEVYKISLGWGAQAYGLAYNV